MAIINNDYFDGKYIYFYVKKYRVCSYFKDVVNTCLFDLEFYQWIVLYLNVARA